MEGLTHVAAILLGVFLTLFLVKSFQKSDDTPAVAVDAAPAVSKSTLRKRKKKKAKPVAPNSDGSAEPKLKEEESVAKELEQQQQQSAPDVINKTATKKKKKKKKSSGAKAPSEAVNEEKKVETIEKEETAVPPPQKPLVQQQQPRKPRKKVEAVDEEEWGVVAGPKKRKPKKPAQTTSAVAVPASSESVTVDAKKIGIIIGPKGATMKALEEATGCRLDINAPSKDDPPPKSSQPQKATIILSGGDKEGMAKAKKALMELASKGYATILQSENFGEFGTVVHPRYLSEIVGSGGKTIQALQSALDVKLTIPSTDWKPNQAEGQVKLCRVGIAGSKENSKQAKAVIQSLIKYHHHEITHPGFIHEQVHVPQEFLHCVIGSRGSEIKHIRGNYKVEMYMPNADSLTDDITIVGRQINVDKAISHINTLMDRDNEQRESRYNDESY